MSEGREDVLNSTSVEGAIRLQYLEGIAKLRYAIIVMAELLYYKHGTSIEDEGSQSYYTNDTELLLDIAKQCCNDDTLNTDNAGPAVFLVKQLARQYGISLLTNLTSDQTMQWIVPDHLQRSNEVVLIGFKYNGHYLITRSNKLVIHLSFIKFMKNLEVLLLMQCMVKTWKNCRE